MGNITDIPLFGGLGEESCSRYAGSLTWRTYGENELVVDIDDQSDDVLFVISGKVRIVHRAEIGKEVIIGDRGPGGYFGEMAAIDGLARSANVTALQTSQIATMPAGPFLELLTHEPDVCKTVLRGLVGGMRSLTRKLSEHAYLTAVERLNCELLRLSRPRPGHEIQRSISPPPTQQELAERIGSRREVVSRAMAALEKDGLIEKTRGALVLPDPGELNRLISEKGLSVNLD